MSLTPQQQQQLVNLLQQPAYAGLSDADAATLAGPTYVPVPYATFQTAVMQLPCWGNVRLAAANIAIYPAALQPAILTAVDLFTNYRGETVDESLPAFQRVLAALNTPVTAGGASVTLVSDVDKAAILALAQVLPVGVVVQTSDVTAARATIAQQHATAALVAKANAGLSAAIALINEFANGPASAAPPTGTQLQQAFAGQVGN